VCSRRTGNSHEKFLTLTAVDTQVFGMRSLFLLCIGASAVSAQVNSTIIVGTNNTLQASASNSVIVGGIANTMGATNSAMVGAANANIPAGVRNSFIGGGNFGTIGAGSHLAVLISGFSNTITPSSPRSVILGGLGNSISSPSSTITGGENNAIDSLSSNSVIAGGSGNRIFGPFTSVSGGQGNIITNNSVGSVIGGGVSNTVTSPVLLDTNGVTNPAIGTIAGGGSNTVTDFAGFVGGGAINRNDAFAGVIAGGLSNTIYGFNPEAGVFTGGSLSFIGGGSQNVVTDYSAVIGGGSFNVNGGFAAVIGGGDANTVRTYDFTDPETLGGDFATISGGTENIAASYGIVPGGYANEAGIDSFAAGNLAKATNLGSFVWSGYYELTETVTTVSTNDYSFTVRAPGGARFISTTNTSFGSISNGVILQPGGNSWAALSDSNAKTAVKPVNARAILHKIAALPVSEWQYKGQPDRHYIGPMAQDFHAAFGLGYDDKTIATTDTDGVMYAAIQGLIEELQDRDERIQKLETQNAALGSKLQAVEERLNLLPPGP